MKNFSDLLFGAALCLVLLVIGITVGILWTKQSNTNCCNQMANPCPCSGNCCPGCGCGQPDCHPVKPMSPKKKTGELGELPATTKAQNRTDWDGPGLITKVELWK